MKLEVGKRYRTRDGRVATVKEIDESKPDDDAVKVQGTFADGGGDLWCGNGSYYSSGSENARDLVAEVVDDGVDAAVPGTDDLESIDLRPGGVVSEAVREFRDARAEPLQVMPDGSLAPVFSPPHTPHVAFPVVIIDGASRELQLMYALEQVTAHFASATAQELHRAAQWLAAKHDLPF